MTTLFSPLKVGGLTLRNRIVISPMCMYSAIDGLVQPWHSMHVGGMAVSGASVVILESTAVESAGRISTRCVALENDDQEVALTNLVRGIRTYSDTPLGIQLSHAGRRASAAIPWQRRDGPTLSQANGGWRTFGPSEVSFGAGWPAPQELDKNGLSRIRSAFADAAQRADRCGFDLLEIHGAHGYLLHSFVSPLANRRADNYGGSLENRLRFPLEVVRSVRAVWPESKAFGLRLNGEDWHSEGTTLRETIVYAQALMDLGVDYVVISGGNAAAEVTPPHIVPGYLVHYAKSIRSEVGILTMTVGMILSAAQGDSIVTSGDADLICIARAALDDPRWGWHAASALGEAAEYPPQYSRAHSNTWPGYQIVHSNGRNQ